MTTYVVNIKITVDDLDDVHTQALPAISALIKEYYSCGKAGADDDSTRWEYQIEEKEAA